jgi:hypothetical protein
MGIQFGDDAFFHSSGIMVWARSIGGSWEVWMVK